MIFVLMLFSLFLSYMHLRECRVIPFIFTFYANDSNKLCIRFYLLCLSSLFFIGHIKIDRFTTLRAAIFRIPIIFKSRKHKFLLVIFVCEVPRDFLFVLAA